MTFSVGQISREIWKWCISSGILEFHVVCVVTVFVCMCFSLLRFPHTLTKYHTETYPCKEVAYTYKTHTHAHTNNTTTKTKQNNITISTKQVLFYI